MAAAAAIAAGEMIHHPILECGVFRFDCSGDHRAAAFPSLSFADPKARETPVAGEGSPEFVPVFECVGGQQKVTVKLPSDSSLYGTGEVGGQLERTGKRIFTWNTDAWGYDPGTPSLYQSHPWVLAVLSDGKALGVLADTTLRCEIDLRESSTIKFTAAAAYPVITFGPFDSPTEVLISLSHAIGTQWLHSRVEMDGYEEYTGIEYRSAGCSEEYEVSRRDLEQSGEEESIYLKGDIGGGLVLHRHISIPKENPKVVKIDSSIIAQSVGAGSGGFSRLVCLRVHPTLALLNPTEVYIAFNSIDGSKHEVFTESGDQSFEGHLRPNGEWMLVDKCAGLSLVNRFEVEQVQKCLVHWGSGTVNLELWSEERPISKDTPLSISHEYEVKSQ